MTAEMLWIALRAGFYGCFPLIVAMLFGLDPAPGMLLVPFFCFITALGFAAFGIAVAASVPKIDQLQLRHDAGDHAAVPRRGHVLPDRPAARGLPGGGAVQPAAPARRAGARRGFGFEATDLIRVAVLIVFAVALWRVAVQPDDQATDRLTVDTAMPDFLHTSNGSSRAVVRQPSGRMLLPTDTGARARGDLLLTGSTGFLGMELLARLLEDTDRRVWAPVRAGDDAEAEARLRATLATLLPDPGTYSERVVAFAADLTQPGSAWAPAAGRRSPSTSRRSSTRPHRCRSRCRWRRRAQINVEGTRQMLELAAECRTLTRFAHVSTAYVAGDHSGDFAETDRDLGQGFNNTYEQSKWEAERLVGEHASELPVQIFRPSIVVGHERSGWTASFNVIYTPLRMYARGALPLIPARRSAPVDIVPVELRRALDPGARRRAVRDAPSTSSPGPTRRRMGELIDLTVSHFDGPPIRTVSPAALPAHDRAGPDAASHVGAAALDRADARSSSRTSPARCASRTTRPGPRSSRTACGRRRSASTSSGWSTSRSAAAGAGARWGARRRARRPRLEPCRGRRLGRLTGRESDGVVLPSGLEQLADLADGHRQRRDVEGAAGARCRRASAGSAPSRGASRSSPPRAPRRLQARSGAQHLGGERRGGRVEVVAQRRARQRLPAILARQRHDPRRAASAARARLPSRKCTAATACTSRPLSSATSTTSSAANMCGERRRCASRAPPGRRPRAARRPARERLEVVGGEQPRQRLVEHGRARAIALDRRGDGHRRAPVAQQPARAALDQAPALEQHRRSGRRRGPRCRAPRSPPLRAHLEHLARDRVGARDLGRRRARLLVQAEDERRAAAVEHVVDHLRRDDLAPQAVAMHLLGEALRQRRREVALELV